MDREAWHAAIHGVTKSWTRLSNWTELNTAKARRTVQRHKEPIDTSKPTTGHCTALQRHEVQLHQLKHRYKLPQPGKHHRTLTQPHPGADSTTKKNYYLENCFFSVLNHAVYSFYIFLLSLLTTFYLWLPLFLLFRSSTNEEKHGIFNPFLNGKVLGVTHW